MRGGGGGGGGNPNNNNGSNNSDVVDPFTLTHSQLIEEILKCFHHTLLLLPPPEEVQSKEMMLMMTEKKRTELSSFNVTQLIEMLIEVRSVENEEDRRLLLGLNNNNNEEGEGEGEGGGGEDQESLEDEDSVTSIGSNGPTSGGSGSGHATKLKTRGSKLNKSMSSSSPSEGSRSNSVVNFSPSHGSSKEKTNKRRNTMNNSSSSSSSSHSSSGSGGSGSGSGSGSGGGGGGGRKTQTNANTQIVSTNTGSGGSSVASNSEPGSFYVTLPSVQPFHAIIYPFSLSILQEISRRYAQKTKIEVTLIEANFSFEGRNIPLSPASASLPPPLPPLLPKSEKNQQHHHHHLNNNNNNNNNHLHPLHSSNSSLVSSSHPPSSHLQSIESDSHSTVSSIPSQSSRSRSLSLSSQSLSPSTSSSSSLKRLKIGYVSSDFGNHPLSHLMLSVFSFHDPSKFEISCYALTPSDTSSWRSQIEAAVEHFHDVSLMSTEVVAHKIYEDQIDVLINLNGYTKGARNDIFVLHPAPIQVAFLGFCGTMGADYIEYLISDDQVTPPHLQHFYDEKIISMPHSYFVNDHRQSSRHVLSYPPRFPPGLDASLLPADLLPPLPPPLLSSSTTPSSSSSSSSSPMNFPFLITPPSPSSSSSSSPTPSRSPSPGPTTNTTSTPQFPTRATYSLPENAFVFCNFNQLYKIDPEIFSVWMRILQRVEGSVLWLLRFPPEGEENLLNEATKRGVDPTRLVFSNVAPRSEHQFRGTLADLFLDTPLCNAHTTACDILWGGTPMVTFPQEKMASRVGASLLSAAGLSQLIVQSYEEYENLCVNLANNPILLWTYKSHLLHTRDLTPIFDTHRWTKNVEQAYERIWDRYVNGDPPDYIRVMDSSAFIPKNNY